jgi:hypothetical protein
MVESYLEALPQRIASAVWQAQQKLVPVRVAAGAGICEINVNRRFRAPEGAMVVGRNWQGAVDRTVRVIRFDDFDERPVATIVQYACHGTIMGWQTDLFTPDFPGPMREVVERELGGTCLFLQGAAANIAPRRGFTGDLQVYRRLGTILGLEASRVAWELETLPREERFTGVLQSGAPLALYEDAAIAPATPVLRVVQRQVELPARAFGSPDKLEAEAAALRAEMNRLRRSGTEEEVRLATAKATQAGWRADYAQRYHGLKHVPWELMGIRIGEIALLSVPGEPFIEIAQAVCERSPFRHTLFSGYSNGGFGYIPTRAAFAEGGYETEATPFAPGVADVLIEESVQLLEELAAPAKSSGFEASGAVTRAGGKL